MHFNILWCILFTMSSPTRFGLFRTSSGWCSYYKKTIGVKCATITP